MGSCPCPSLKARRSFPSRWTTWGSWGNSWNITRNTTKGKVMVTSHFPLRKFQFSFPNISIKMHWSLWEVWHLSQAKLLNCNRIPSHAAEQTYVAIIDSMLDFNVLVLNHFIHDRVLANYLLWRLILGLAPELTEKYQWVRTEYRESANGTSRGTDFRHQGLFILNINHWFGVSAWIFALYLINWGCNPL